MENCCYFFGLRMGCILGGLWLLLYFSGLAYFMYYEIDRAELIETVDLKGVRRLAKDTDGFWVLGISFLVMDFMTLLLIFGAIMKRIPLIVLFLFGQGIPITVECYFLFEAMLYGLEIETVFLYLLPLFYLVYIDVVAYAYWRDLRGIKGTSSVSTDINIEY